MRLVLLGTGTSIGKTHLGVALLTALRRRGEEACGLKPIESGVAPGELGEDARALSEAGVFHVKHPQPYALPDPVSPHLAARRAGITLDLSVATSWVDAHSARWLVIETAGALLSPIAPGFTNLDLAVALRPDLWILVAPDRLGVLHDVAASILALGALCSPPVTPLVVLQAPASPDDSTGTNAAELETLGVAPRVLTMPRGESGSDACQAVADEILDHAAARSTR